jgi:hypothetical protein
MCSGVKGQSRQGIDGGNGHGFRGRGVRDIVTGHAVACGPARRRSVGGVQERCRRVEAEWRRGAGWRRSGGEVPRSAGGVEERCRGVQAESDSPNPQEEWDSLFGAGPPPPPPPPLPPAIPPPSLTPPPSVRRPSHSALAPRPRTPPSHMQPGAPLLRTAISPLSELLASPCSHRCRLVHTHTCTRIRLRVVCECRFAICQYTIAAAAAAASAAAAVVGQFPPQARAGPCRRGGRLHRRRHLRHRPRPSRYGPGWPKTSTGGPTWGRAGRGCGRGGRVAGRGGRSGGGVDLVGAGGRARGASVAAAGDPAGGPGGAYQGLARVHGKACYGALRVLWSAELVGLATPCLLALLVCLALSLPVLSPSPSSASACYGHLRVPVDKCCA